MPDLSLPVAVAVFVAASGAILVAGPRMVSVAETLADRTGLGEALMGAIFIGAATSVPDGMATLIPAIGGLADLAVGNALGGILGQTTFLAIADVFYRSASLERSAAAVTNLIQGTTLIMLLSLLLVLFNTPSWDVFGMHPVSLAPLVVYWFGMRAVAQASYEPMWRPVATPDVPTKSDVPEEERLDDESTSRLWISFAVLAGILALCGWLVVPAAEQIAASTGLSRTAAGTFLTGVSSSLAELVVSISAVRAGALALAVGNVFGGNMFDALLVGAADVAYREGPIYAALTPEHSLIAAMAALMTALTVLGLLRRQRAVVAKVGTESVIVLVLYAITASIVGL